MRNLLSSAAVAILATASLLGCAGQIVGEDGETALGVPATPGWSAPAKGSAGTAGGTGGGAAQPGAMTAPGKPPAAAGGADQMCVEPAGTRRLTANEASNILGTLLGLPTPNPDLFPDDQQTSRGFENSAHVQVLGLAAVERIYNTVYELVDRGFTSPGPVPPDFRACTGAGFSDCVRQRLPGFLRKAFRRPAAAPEQATIVMVFDQGGATPEALRRAVLTTLLWPRFWFVVRAPHLTAGAALSPHDVAERLALMLWGSFPDDELAQLADTRQVLDPMVLARQADRLLKDPKASFFFENFTSQWLGMGRLDAISPAEKRLVKLSPEILADMKRETTEFVRQLILQGRPLSELVEANYSFVNTRLAALYGTTTNAKTGFERAMMANPRLGLLGHASILTQTSHDGATSTIHRGLFVTRKLLCREPPAPPPDLADMIMAVNNQTKNPTPLQKVQGRLDTPLCTACHANMDPLGLAMEVFDDVGRLRSKYADGSPVITRAMLAGQPTDDLAAALPKLARDPAMGPCLVEHLAAYLLEQDVQLTRGNGCQLQVVVRRPDLASMSINKLIVEIISAPEFQRL